MITSDTPVAEQYIRLVLAADQHMPGYFDTYYGPATWRDEANAAGPRPLRELQTETEALLDAVNDDQSLNAQRREYLASHVKSLHTTLRLLQGEQMGLAEEVEALYDVTPAWVDEEEFREAHREIDDLLPPGDSLRERMLARRRMLEVPVDVARELLPYVYSHLRSLTQRHFPLPEDESCAIEFVSNTSWPAYMRYQGKYSSRIEINTDLPIQLNHLIDLAAHEAYPGHHTEFSIKEAGLVDGEGRMELAVFVVSSPACTVAEGIATYALRTILPDQELVPWLQEEVMPRAHMDHVDAAAMRRVEKAADKLNGLSTNAVFLIYEQHADDAVVSRYFQEYGMVTPENAAKRIEILRDRRYRAYNFTYLNGSELVGELLTSVDDPIHWYGRLLTEAVTPGQVRRWMAG